VIGSSQIPLPAQHTTLTRDGHPCPLLYPGVDGKKPGDVGVTERHGLLRDAGSRPGWTLKN